MILRMLLIFVLVMLGAFAATEPVPAPAVNRAAIVRLVDPSSRSQFCTGFVVSNTHIITAAHCVSSELMGVEFARIQVVEVRNEQGLKIANATLESFDSKTDLAFLFGDFTALPKMQVDLSFQGMQNSLKAPLLSCGYPWGEQLVCTEVSEIAQYVIKLAGIGNMFPGMSGGPLIDMRTGRAVALNTGIQEYALIFSPLLGIQSRLNSRL